MRRMFNNDPIPSFAMQAKLQAAQANKVAAMFDQNNVAEIDNLLYKNQGQNET